MNESAYLGPTGVIDTEMTGEDRERWCSGFG